MIRDEHLAALRRFDAAGGRRRAILRDIARAESSLVALRDQLAATDADARRAWDDLGGAPEAVWSLPPARPVPGL